MTHLFIYSESVGGHGSGSGSSATSGASSHKYVVRISDGKLFYEKRWFHRGQNIYIDSKDTGKVSAVISSIGTNEVSVNSSFQGHYIMNRFVLKYSWEKVMCMDSNI